MLIIFNELDRLGYKLAVLIFFYIKKFSLVFVFFLDKTDLFLLLF